MCKKAWIIILWIITPLLCTAKNIIDENDFLNHFYLKEEKSFELGAGGDYLRPKNIAQKYNFVPDFEWGFHVLGTYKFLKGTDITLEWRHYKLTQRGIDGRVDGFMNEGPVDVQFDLDNGFNLFSLVLGQTIYFEDAFSFHVFGGFLYADIFNGSAYAFQSNRTRSTESRNILEKWSGGGPFFGLMLSYYLTPSTSILIEGRNAILVNMRYRVQLSKTHIDRRRPVPRRDVQEYNIISSDNAGAFFSRIGVNHVYSLPNGKLTLNGGWNAINYSEEGLRWEGWFVGGRLIADL